MHCCYSKRKYRDFSSVWLAAWSCHAGTCRSAGVHDSIVNPVVWTSIRTKTNQAASDGRGKYCYLLGHNVVRIFLLLTTSSESKGSARGVDNAGRHDKRVVHAIHAVLHVHTSPARTQRQYTCPWHDKADHVDEKIHVKCKNVASAESCTEQEKTEKFDAAFNESKSLFPI